MSDTLPNADPQQKKSGRCCLSCLVIFAVLIALLLGLFFLGPKIGSWLGIFGLEAREAYEAAPDLAGSQSLTEAFQNQGIAGVKIYVIPIKDTSQQGAFIILDGSAGYQGLDPRREEDDMLLFVLGEISRRNREENLRLAHITVDYRDENGETATSFTVDQDVVDRYAAGQITQKEFFASIEIDLLGTIQYLGIGDLLKELQE